MATRAKPKKYPLKQEYRGVVYEFVDKTMPELRGELTKFVAAIRHADRLMKPLQRFPNPVMRAVRTHINSIAPLTKFDTAEDLAKEICRLNLSFIEAVRMLDTLCNTTIQPIEELRFHLTYSCTHKKRDLSSGWNKGKHSVDDTEHELEPE